MYMVLGANWRVGGIGATEEARKQLKIDNSLTWRYAFGTGKWTSIDHNPRKLFRCSPYENHLQYWPGGKKLLFLDYTGRHYAEFDLKTRTWEAVETKNRAPMRLYNARSAWDVKRGLWIFRLGPRLCTFDPATKSFSSLPQCWEMKIPTRGENKRMRKEKKKPDKRLGWKGICYISKHDRYLVTGPTGNDTMVYNPATKEWRRIEGGAVALPNGYCQYSPMHDLVAMNFHLDCYVFRYVPPGHRR